MNINFLFQSGMVSIAMLLLGCAPPVEPLRIGINAWPGCEFLYLAQEKGFYRAAGVEVRIVEFSSLSDVRRAFERGQLDVMGTTVIEVLQARDQSNRSPQIVQVVDASEGADLILAHPSIKNGAQLRGKRIGVELASLGVYVLARGLAKHGLALIDVKTVSMSQEAMLDTFLKGELDAVVTYPPTSIKLLREHLAQSVFSTAEIPAEVIDVIAVEEEVTRRRPADVAKVVRAFHQALDYSAQNPTDAHAIMAAREGITPAEFREALTDGIKIFSAAEQADYFKPGGKLSSVVDASDRILRQSKQINGPDRRANISNARFIGNAQP